MGKTTLYRRFAAPSPMRFAMGDSGGVKIDARLNAEIYYVSESRFRTDRRIKKRGSNLMKININSKEDRWTLLLYSCPGMLCVGEAIGGERNDS